jgi:hypothetical protein
VISPIILNLKDFINFTNFSNIWMFTKAWEADWSQNFIPWHNCSFEMHCVFLVSVTLSFFFSPTFHFNHSAFRIPFHQPWFQSNSKSAYVKPFSNPI